MEDEVKDRAWQVFWRWYSLPPFDEELFKRLRGTMPGITGDMTTGEFIDFMRGEDS